MKKWRCDVIKQCCEGYSFIWKSDKLKAIWYEIPRCGSTAMKTMFRETPEYEFKLLDNVDADSVYDQYPDYFKFTIGRNPWDRVVSNYNLYRNMDYRVPQTIELFKLDSIEDFTFEFFLEGFQKNVNHHWEQCYKYLPTKDIDYYGRLDIIDDNWLDIKDKLGITDDRKIPNPKNRGYFGFNSGHGDYTKFYNDETIQLISDIYSKDIELFDFEFNEQKRVL